MSKRHHYVPQVHIKKFSSTSGFYVLIKKNKLIVNPKSSKDIFVKTNLNTSSNLLGVKNDDLEKTLTNKWDSKFSTHYKEVINHLEEPHKISQDSRIFLFNYAIVSWVRTRKKDKNLNEQYYSSLLKNMNDARNEMIMGNYKPSLESKIDDMLFNPESFSMAINTVKAIQNLQKEVKYTQLYCPQMQINLALRIAQLMFSNQTITPSFFLIQQEC